MSERLRPESEVDPFGEMADLLPIVIWRSDQSGRCVYVNRAWRDFVGVNSARSPGVGWQQNLHPDDRELASKRCELHHQNHQPYRSEYRIRRADGQYRSVVDHALPKFDADGSFTGFVGALVDISERVEAEREVELQAELLRQAARMAKIGAWELALRDQSVRWSDEVYRIHEIDQGESINLQQALSFYAPEFQETIQAAVELGMREGIGWDLKLQIVTAKSARRWVRAIGAPEFQDGACVRLFGTFQDITAETEAAEQRRILEQQLLQSQKMEALGTLAGGIAHDFNNILAALMGTLGVLELKTPPGSETLIHIHQSMEACFRARSLVSQILTFSRRSAPGADLRDGFAPCNLAESIQQGLVLLRAGFPESVSIHFDPGPEPIWVRGDPSQLFQVVMNLVTNAAHAVESKGGDVRLSLERVLLSESERRSLPELQTGDLVRLTVSDDGVGIPPGLQPRIFEPFFTTREPGRGTGLGLSVVHGIVVAHRGAIRVTSTVGEGSTFSLYLPAHSGSGAAEASNSKSSVQIDEVSGSTRSA